MFKNAVGLAPVRSGRSREAVSRVLRFQYHIYIYIVFLDFFGGFLFLRQSTGRKRSPKNLLGYMWAKNGPLPGPRPVDRSSETKEKRGVCKTVGGFSAKDVSWCFLFTLVVLVRFCLVFPRKEPSAPGVLVNYDCPDAVLYIWGIDLKLFER